MEISIHQDRVSISVNEKVKIQLVIWDLEKSEHEFLKNQINLIMAISDKLDYLVKHLKINGFDTEIEDIHEY